MPFLSSFNTRKRACPAVHGRSSVASERTWFRFLEGNLKVNRAQDGARWQDSGRPTLRHCQ